MEKITIELRIKRVEMTLIAILIVLAAILCILALIAQYISNDITDKKAEAKAVETFETATFRLYDNNFSSFRKIPTSTPEESEKYGYNIN